MEASGLIQDACYFGLCSCIVSEDDCGESERHLLKPRLKALMLTFVECVLVIWDTKEFACGAIQMLLSTFVGQA